MGALDGEPAVGAPGPPAGRARLTPPEPQGDPHWTRLEALFDGALTASEADRAAWLAAACPDDPALRAEVARMLEAHRLTGILDRTPAALGWMAGARRFADTDPDPDAIRTRLAGALDGRYVVERELGRGGMAIVYLARERKHGRRVVLKVLRPEVGIRYGTERFVREVQIAARLAHPHIVGLLDSGDAQGLLYYVMPWVEGESLHARVAREGALPVAEAVSLLADVAGALAHAHRHGVVHRDLKPANVLWADGHAFLLDFGVAKLALPMSGDDPVDLLAVTREGHAVGTLAYMAPEQGA
ncbi:MAG: serine/threonine-protein kinase, partial [Solirubrobacteraceae bacterium]